MPIVEARWRGWLLALWLLSSAGGAWAAEYRPLPPQPPAGLDPDGWLLHNSASNRLILYLPGYHAPAHTYYQWLRLVPLQPFRLSFTAAPRLSLFLDNRLIFTAPAAGRYTLDLGAAVGRAGQGRPHLLAVWQPDGSPLLSSFGVDAPTASTLPTAATDLALLRIAPASSQNVLLLFLLLLGLLYGVLRGAFPAALAPVLQLSDLRGVGSEPQAFLTRPVFTWLNLSLVVLFALTLAVLLTALHTDLGGLPLLRQLFDVPDSAAVARVLLYTGLVLAFVLAKFVLVELMSYIFDLREVVNVQFREFLRTTLLLGLVLPVVLLLYLALASSWPPVAQLANGAVLVVLALPVLRVAYTLHQRVPLLNLHLFAYLCATEILPLVVLLKLIVFTYSA